MTGLGRAVAALLVAAALAVAPARAAEWTPAAWSDVDTLELTTVAPGEAPHTFPVWLVVLDGDVFVRLGSRAAERVETSTTAPLVGVRIAGAEFATVRAEPMPDAAARVAAAMRAKYWTDVFVRWLDHPLTLRLRPQ